MSETWINVHDSLPDIGEVVLVHLQSKVVKESYGVARREIPNGTKLSRVVWRDENASQPEYFNTTSVTHWRRIAGPFAVLAPTPAGEVGK